jgi:hypothetical protein
MRLKIPNSIDFGDGARARLEAYPVSVQGGVIGMKMQPIPKGFAPNPAAPPTATPSTGKSGEGSNPDGDKAKS